jgi:carboxypeptidase T
MAVFKVRELKSILGSVVLLGSLLVGGETKASERHELQSTANMSKIVTIRLTDYQAGLSRLSNDGFDIAGIDLTNQTVDIVVNAAGYITLKSLNLGDIVRTQEIDPSKGPDSRYTDYNELMSILESYQARFPDLVKLESIGKSHEGREIWAVKISDNVADQENEPAIFFNAMHHAREVMTTEVALDMIEQLTGNYGEDESVTGWVDQNEIWIIPMVNPDGNNKVWTSNSMWRKNTRGGYGVDINRNYPYAWGSCGGSSGSTYSDTYRGPSAGSEPETQAVMELVSRINPVISVSYHSYSEIVIYPYGCDGERADEREVVEGLGQQLAKTLVKDSGKGTYGAGTAWELLYAVDGGDIDWYHHAHKVLPYVIEVNSSSQGFQPPYSWRQSTVERMRPGWALMLNRLGQSGVRGVVTLNGERARTGSVTVAPLAIEKQMKNESLTYPLKADGSYHIILKPGMYRVRYQDGTRFVDRDITVGGDRVDLDLELSL